MNELAPPVTVLVKLGSIAVHADEMLSPGGHDFDRVALHGLLSDPEVVEWLAGMDRMAMVPKKRSAPAVNKAGVRRS